MRPTKPRANPDKTLKLVAERTVSQSQPPLHQGNLDQYVCDDMDTEFGKYKTHLMIHIIAIQRPPKGEWFVEDHGGLKDEPTTEEILNNEPVYRMGPFISEEFAYAVKAARTTWLENQVAELRQQNDPDLKSISTRDMKPRKV